MPPMISIVGKSGSGKTTLIVKLIPELKKRGYRIGTVKHTSHGFDVDKKGKDSDRHKSAGAETVIVASRNRIAMVRDMECDTLDALEPFFQDMDLVITEGYKQENRPKIEVFRTAAQKTPLFGDKQYNSIVAVITDADVAGDLPTFGLDDIQSIADFIEGNYL
ncbi:molybdopterin-guanine dinucleotide biosynthesis protein B [Desulfonema ishimotonii]|uniref:Molybdopterin-guanine dinucleotide biosynthesis protein B n=1 Tax=Desulfonema ishimotonii TaxID=45657 RepID=A0A401FW55_9BACT|nr:molybdopterin-guanine dinucleotide biosynthesis protein B [Desulfonema ishimotonii]GBC61191.1 molybdopterin-guanine dinucleotide biosynthesis protein B [Desulfonema ishimotonii]